MEFNDTKNYATTKYQLTGRAGYEKDGLFCLETHAVLSS